MAGPWEDFSSNSGESAGPWSDFQSQEAAPKKSSLARRVLGDTGVSLLKGAVAVPEAAVGIADIVSGGLAGKYAEQAGFRPKEAKAALDEMYSPEQKAANQYVQEGDGFLDTIKRGIERPSVIGQSVAESLPLLLPGAAAARGIGAATKVAPYIAGAAGEGLVGAGSAAEQLRQGSEDGTISGKQTLGALASGVGTAGFGALGGKLASSTIGKKLGISDIDTVLAGGASNPANVGLAKRALSGAVSEGVLEELPQSMWEQAAQNYATDKPLGEGVGQAGAMGLLAGTAMGGTFNAMQRGEQRKAVDDANPAVEETPAAAPLGLTYNANVRNGEDPLYTFPDGSTMSRAEYEQDRANKEQGRLDSMIQPADPEPKLQETGPMSSAVNVGVDSGATSLRPQGSFSDMSEFANLLGQEQQDVQSRRTGIAHRQALQREVALQDADQRVADQMAKEAAQRRRAVLDQVLSDPTTQNPADRFAAELQRQGFRDSTPTADELATVKRFNDIKAAEPAGPEIEPSLPNEVDAEQLGIKPKQSAKSGSAPQARDKVAEVRQLVADGWKISNKTLVSPTGKKRILNTAEHAAAKEATRERNLAAMERYRQSKGKGTPVSTTNVASEETNAPEIERKNKEAPQANDAQVEPQPSAAPSIKQLQAELEKTDPFTSRSSKLIEKLQNAVTNDAQSALDSGEMPVYKVTDHVSVAVHPSAQNPGKIQVTRYTNDGVIGDSQYNSIDDAVRQEGLTHKPRIGSGEAIAHIEKSIAAEAEYQSRKSESKQVATDPAVAQSDVEDYGKRVVRRNKRAETNDAPVVEVKENRGPSQISKRDDLVGAIMRVTGGNGVAASMSQTITGDTANRASKVRGLFTNAGTMDLDDIANDLRTEEGYDVRDGNHLAELIREQAAGNPVYSMERNERDAAANEEKKQKDAVLKQANELGLKGVGGKRTLAVVEAEIAKVEAERNELEKRQERAAIQAEAIAEKLDVDGLDLTEADLMSWLGSIVEYTQDDINEANSRASEIAGRRAETNAIVDSEGQAKSSGGERAENGSTQEGARSNEGFDLAKQTNQQAAEQFAQQNAPESDQVSKEQVDRERDAVPFSMQQQSQPKPQGRQTGLFTADGRVSSEANASDSKVMFSRSDSSALDTANRRMSKFVDAYLAGELEDGNNQLLGQTPTVLQSLGKPNLQIEIDYATINKVLSGKHKLDITPEILKQIPQGIYDPAAVFSQANGGVLMITDLVAENGNPVAVAIHFRVDSGIMKVNRIASAYEYNRFVSRFIEQARNLQYVKNEKALIASATADTPNWSEVVQKARELGVNVLTEADVVKDYGSRFSFAGRSAATADQFALSNAEKRIEAGDDAEEVRKETGWFKGADGKWRFEIDDSDAKPTDKWGSLLDKSSKYARQYGYSLSQVLDHPALFAAYPELKSFRVYADSSIGSGTKGALSIEDGKIRINNSMAGSDLFSTLLHEIQHGIQSIEGFAMGGSANQFESRENSIRAERDVINAVTKARNRIEYFGETEEQALRTVANNEGRDLSKMRHFHETYPGQELDARYKESVQELGRSNAMDRYKRLAGEVEARNVQSRQPMTAEQRRERSPASTQDVSDSDVIVIFNGKVMQDAPMPANASRGQGSGMAFRDLQAVVDRVSKGFNNLPKIHVLDSPRDLSDRRDNERTLKEQIEQAGAMDDVEGAHHNGEIYLFASGIASEERAEHVLATHEITHYGLRGTMGKGLDSALQNIWLYNKEVRAKAAVLRMQLGLTSNVSAVEEVLAEMKDSDLVNLKGWRKMVQAFRDWAHKAGFDRIAEKLDGLITNGMSDQEKADLFVANMVNAARDWVRNGKPARGYDPGTSMLGDANFSAKNKSASVDASITEIFDGLAGRGLKKQRAEERLAEHSQAESIRYVQDNILDILEELEGAGTIKINC